MSDDGIIDPFKNSDANAGIVDPFKDIIDPFKSTEKAGNKPPRMFLSTDPSGKLVAAPSTDYRSAGDEPEITPPLQRIKEGISAPYQDPLGISKENLEKYPWAKPLQPIAQGLDALSRAPAAVVGGASGAIASAVEPLTGPSWADRLQRDLYALSQSIAPEAPINVAGALRRAEANDARIATANRPTEAPAPVVPPVAADVPRATPRDVGTDTPITLLPPEVPHTLPAERRSLGAAGATGPLSETNPETIAHMRSVMEEQGFTPHTLEQRLEEMSAHQFLGEMTPSLEADMGAVAAPPGPGKQEVVNSTRQRALEGRERVQAELDRSFGVNEDVAQLKQILQGERAQAVQPFYERFRQTPITPTPQITALMPRLQASGALQAANKALAVEGLPLTAGFRWAEDRTGLAGGEFSPAIGEGATQVPTASAFQYAKEFLDDKIESALANPGGANEARRLTQLKNDLVQAIDNHPDANVAGIWRQARETYQTPSQILSSIDMGKRILTNHISAEDLPFLTSSFSQDQMRGLRVGMRSYLQQLLGKKGVLTQETLNTILSPNNENKFRWILGDEAADNLLQAIRHEQEMHGAPTRLYGNSPTALRQEAQKRWTVQPGTLDKVTLSDVAGAVTHPAKTAVGVAEKFGLSKRKAAKEAKMARLREEASRLFTAQGPERDAIARYLMGMDNGVGLRGFARGGAVTAAHIDRAASKAHRNPSDAQKQAGNYRKGHINIHGLDVSIENAKGSQRRGVGSDGQPWSVLMPVHYGYVRKSTGADGDQVDCYIGPHVRSPRVYVMDQKDAETGAFDEHKCFLGFASIPQVKKIYRQAFSDGKADQRMGAITEMPIETFKKWIKSEDPRQPVVRHYEARV
jgi:Inorganic Pyrophosphatase